MNIEFIETERLRLNRMYPEDFQRIFDNYGKEDIIRLLGFTNEAKYEKELGRYQSGYLQGKRPFVFFQIIRKVDQQIMGGCGLHNWVKEHHRAEIGYDLYDDKFMRQGYMTEALAEVLAYGFKEMNLNRIEACVYKDNLVSLAILKKFKFRYEGNLRSHYFMNGEFTDSMLFSLLYEEGMNS